MSIRDGFRQGIVYINDILYWIENIYWNIIRV